ncbi:MAG: acyl-CoA carboxylase subunit beta [Candidatus Sumerlaeia bacterium]|nr:acyl-CoA carboxylase subunit beta [Candidatus Sumerlaeia bacterium]
MTTVAPSPSLESNLATCRELADRLAANALAGDAKAIARQHAKHKLTVAERFDLLFDKEGWRVEIGAFAADGMYGEFGGDIRSAGCRAVVGLLHGRPTLALANDSMVKAGAWLPMTIKKMLRAQEVALENRLPTVYLVDSAGVFLPLQEDIFPDREHAGRIFYNNSVMSAEGIPQVAVVCGPCVAGGAYLPVLCDEMIIVKGTGHVFLAGPYLVEAAIGEKTDAESLGGAEMHGRLSGTADYEEPSEESALAKVREIARSWPRSTAGLRREEPAAPATDPEEILAILPDSRQKPYDMRRIIDALVDGGSFLEFKKNYGQTLICGTARIEGWHVGIVANQRLIVKSAQGELQMGGVIYSDSADKAARFVMNCNQKGLPIVYLQDVTGFMVGSRAERGGIIKDGAKLVNAVSNSRVPQFTVVVGNSNGAGNYALCGRAYGPRFMLSWPMGRISVMGGEQAAKTLLSLEKQRRAKDPMTPEEEAAFLSRMIEHYSDHSSPYHAASRLWIDAVIDPRGTRGTLAKLLEIADEAPLADSFRTGVLQT